MVDREGAALVVGDNIGMLEEGAAERVLRRIGGAAKWEVSGRVGEVRVRGRQLKIEGGVGELDTSIRRGRVEIIAESECDTGVLPDKGGVNGVVDKVKLER